MKMTRRMPTTAMATVPRLPRLTSARSVFCGIGWIAVQGSASDWYDKELSTHGTDDFDGLSVGDGGATLIARGRCVASACLDIGNFAYAARGDGCNYRSRCSNEG